jgi:hypothetical protein
VAVTVRDSRGFLEIYALGLFPTSGNDMSGRIGLKSHVLSLLDLAVLATPTVDVAEVYETESIPLT